MITFEVSLNGKRACVAGVEDFGVLSAILTWVRRRPESSRDGRTVEEELTVEVSGLRSQNSGPGEHLKWFNRTLSIGDRISIRVVDASKVDQPKTRYRNDPATVLRAKRRYFERLKEELEVPSATSKSSKGAAPDRRDATARAKRKAPHRGRGG